MAKVSRKLQITLPKAVAERCGIRVGDELDVRPMGRSILIDRRAVPGRARLHHERLGHFDEATKRQRARQTASPVGAARSRGWTREELYARGRAR